MRPQSAHVARFWLQGMALVHYLFGDDPNSRPAHENVASAVFTTPQIATVGLTEEQAAKKYPNLNIYKSTFRWALVRDALMPLSLRVLLHIFRSS